MQIEVDKIKVKKRARVDLGDIDGLASSIKRNGLLTPITITDDFVLIAGERRLRAVQKLGWKKIEAVQIAENDKAKLLEMEIEENTFRLPFSDDELIKSYKRLNSLRNPNIFMRIWNWITKTFKNIGKKNTTQIKKD